MSHTTSLRRTASALGATALLGAVLAAPAMARQDPGTGAPAASSSTTIERERRDGGMTYPQLDTAPRKGAVGTPPTIVFMEYHGVEYLQIGAGLVAGMALAGAGVVVASRRNQGGLSPA